MGDVRLLGPRSRQKITVRHLLGSPVAAVPDRLARAFPFNPLKPFDGYRFADRVAPGAARRLISPLFTASITRSRKSCEYGFGIPAGLRPANRLNQNLAVRQSRIDPLTATCRAIRRSNPGSLSRRICATRKSG